MDFSQINYSHRDLISLIKFNTARLTETDEKDLYVEVRILKDKNQVDARVTRLDKQNLTINNEI